MKKIFFTIFILTAFAHTVSASESLRFGYIHFPPYLTGKMPDNNVPPNQGLIIDLLKIACNDANLSVVFNPYPPSRMKHLFEDGSLDLAIAVAESLPENIKKISVISKPLAAMDICLYQNIERSKEIVDLKSQLLKKFIIVPKESKPFFEKLVPKENKFYEAVYPHKIVKMFVHGRADFFMDFSARSDYNFKAFENKIPEYKKFTLLTVHVVILARKGIPDAKVLTDKIIRSVYKLRNSDQLKQLYRKYKTAEIFAKQ